MDTGEICKESRELRRSLANPKILHGIACWNTVEYEDHEKHWQNSSGNIRDKRYRISILEVSECRWAGFGRLRTRTGETILYSGREDDVRQSGVAIFMTRHASREMSEELVTCQLDSTLNT